MWRLLPCPVQCLGYLGVGAGVSDIEANTPFELKNLWSSQCGPLNGG